MRQGGTTSAARRKVGRGSREPGWVWRATLQVWVLMHGGARPGGVSSDWGQDGRVLSQPSQLEGLPRTREGRIWCPQPSAGNFLVE